MQNQQVALSPSAPNFELQYFEPFIAAPAIQIDSKELNEFKFKVYGHAHMEVTLDMSAKNKKGFKILASKIATLGISNKASVTLKSAAGNDLIKIQRDAFGKRFLVKSPHNNILLIIFQLDQSNQIL